MYQFDEQNWPLVVVRPTGSITLADMEHYAARLDAWLSRGEHFGLLVVVEGEEHGKHDKALTKFDNDMWKRLHEAMRTWCVGYAGVTAAAEMYERYKPLAPAAVRKRIGCAGEVFMTEDEARAWLRDKLRQNQEQV
ncbi:MAG: STAS/SEC14 domain-containing protein [Chloroflexaceae bacterium]|nr:STAS/SEC14 domain-containing protein [Chloroflexaceae bacterium]